MSIDIGDTKKLRLSEIKDESGDLVDPTEVTIAIRAPDGTITTHTLAADEVVRNDLGDYFFLLELTQAGAWQYRWNTSGGVDLAEAGALIVGSDPIVEAFADDSFTVADVWARSPTLQKRFARGGADADLNFLVATVAPVVGSLTGRAIAGTEGEEVPPALRELELRAIALKTEQYDSVFGTSKSRRRSLSRGGLASFSAGSYSESYFGPQQIVTYKQLDSDPTLAEILWELCTDHRKLEWLALWDPANYAVTEGSIIAFEYGDRPNYSPGAWPYHGWW